MHVLVNALSVTNASGRHVLLGHLRELSRRTSGQHVFTVLHHAANRDIARDMGNSVRWTEAPACTSNWCARAVWERAALEGVARRIEADFIFSPAGTATPGLRLPQVVFCQNPWALVLPDRSLPARLKAVLQRHAYRAAVRSASVMVFNSCYMRESYKANAGEGAPARTIIAYQGIDDETFSAAAQAVRRVPNQVVSVSAMSNHKGVETVVAAVGKLRGRNVSAMLHLVGQWPDAAYERRIRSLVQALDLGHQVVFAGHVGRERLHRYYGESRVFCLMSRCESFGIPAVEAQAFGTPVVSSDCCAIPEVCGMGGVYCGPRDAEGVAAELERLLADDTHWQRLSACARANAQRFRWPACSEPLMQMFEDVRRIPAAQEGRGGA